LKIYSQCQYRLQAILVQDIRSELSKCVSADVCVDALRHRQTASAVARQGIAGSNEPVHGASNVISDTTEHGSGRRVVQHNFDQSQ
jgi:hypothetical protein